MAAVLLASVAALVLCSSAQAEVTRSGTLEAIVADDFRGGEATTRYILRSGARETPLRPTDLGAEPGDRVVVRGEMRAGKLTGEVEALGESPPPAALAAPRKVAVVLARFPSDPAQPWSPEITRSKIFTAGNSVNAFYKEESHGEISLAGKLNPNGDVFGWYTINTPTAGCPFEQWSDAADAAAAGAGVNLDGYDHVIYVVPPRSGCGWLGIATVGGSWSMINGNQGVHPIAHELGHNLGLRHAGSWTCSADGVRVPLSDTCGVTEYGDPFDVMGNIAPRHNNGSNLEQLGTLAPENVETVEGSGTYALRAALNPSSQTTALRVPATVFPGKLDSWFYLEVRQTGGVFENVTDATMSGVSIRATQTSSPSTVLLDMNPATPSFADAPLKVGQTFEAGAVSIRTVAAGAGSALVSVELDEEPPSAPTGLTATAGAAGVRLRWDASSDNIGVERYVVFRDGEQIGAPAETEFTDSLALPGEHTYVVQAEDEARNRSAEAATTATLDAIEGPDCEGGECRVAYLYTGAPATWTVPLGVEQARFIAEGAQGGDSSAGTVDGGARVNAVVESLTTGEQATIAVGGKGESHADGGAGGFGGGGDGTRGGGGGGASSVEIDSTLMLLAAGAGGAGLAGVDASGEGEPTGGRGGRGSEEGFHGNAGAALSALGATLGGGAGGVRGGNAEAGGTSGGGGGGKGGAVTGTSTCPGGAAAGGKGASGGDLVGGGGAPNAGGGGGGGYIGGGQGGGGATDACGNSAGSGGGGGGASYADESLSWGVQGAVRRGYGRVTIVYPNPVVALDHSYLTMPGEELVVAGAEGVRAGTSGPDGAPLSLGLVAPTAHGDLTLEDDGSFSYQPDPGYTGVDSFTYRLDHPLGHYAIAMVTINVPADPSAQISSPPDGGTYELGQSVTVSFKCVEGAGGTGLDSCDDSRGRETVSGGSNRLDTSTLGSHTYTVTAVSKTGLTGNTSIAYEVVPQKPKPPQEPAPPDEPDGPSNPDTPPRTPDGPRPDPPVADTAAPETRIGARPARKTRHRRARFAFSSSEPGSSFACKLDRRPFKPCVSGVAYRVAPGRHLIKVRATDAAGNSDPTPAAFSWKVERTRKR